MCDCEVRLTTKLRHVKSTGTACKTDVIVASFLLSVRSLISSDPCTGHFHGDHLKKGAAHDAELLGHVVENDVLCLLVFDHLPKPCNSEPRK